MKPNKRVDAAKSAIIMLVKTFLRSISRGSDLGEMLKRSLLWSPVHVSGEQADAFPLPSRKSVLPGNLLLPKAGKPRRIFRLRSRQLRIYGFDS
jgi:hypothetical protein